MPCWPTSCPPTSTGRRTGSSEPGQPGAIAGPLLAIVLWARWHPRGDRSVGPAWTPRRRRHRVRHPPHGAGSITGPAPIRLRVRPVLRGQLGRLMIGVTAFEIGTARHAAHLAGERSSFSRRTRTRPRSWPWCSTSVTTRRRAGERSCRAPCDRHGAIRLMVIGPRLSPRRTSGRRRTLRRSALAPRSCSPASASAAPRRPSTGSRQPGARHPAGLGLRTPPGIQAAGNLAASTIAGGLDGCLTDRGVRLPRCCDGDRHPLRHHEQERRGGVISAEDVGHHTSVPWWRFAVGVLGGRQARRPTSPAPRRSPCRRRRR